MIQNPLLQKILLSSLLLYGFPAIGDGNAVSCRDNIAQLVSAQGKVESFKATTENWQPASINQTYCNNDKVRTQALSRAVLSMGEDVATYLALSENTLLNFLGLGSRVLLSVEQGQVYVRSHTHHKFDITTPHLNAGIEGTEFLIDAKAEGVEITVFEGKVRAYNQRGEVRIENGQTAAASANTVPVTKLLLHPEDSVQWALYYPPIIDTEGFADDSSNATVTDALSQYHKGNAYQALTTLNRLSEQDVQPDILAIKIGLLLTLGKIDQAQQLLNQGLIQTPNHALLLAQQAIINLTQNNKTTAQSYIDRAVKLAPDNATVHIAHSYIQQAQFQLPAALASVEAALKLAPDNALAHSRHAELLASLGDTQNATQAAAMAVKYNPNIGRAYAVLGFTRLMDNATEAAETDFKTALSKDASDPLAHFGLALAAIRKNHLDEGVTKLEHAASLDPNDSLIRSYLGKAYYEQNRLKIAELQFKLAEENDPKDPTPYFYQAIAKQTTNQPTQALTAVNKAIELNDNRAVYRSRQLLDQDQAARSASLARIYTDLGFTKAALTEASKSVLQDPTNFSAHRFLADTYTSMPNQQVARVSEILQMQLWQPNNLAMLQPQLSQPNLGILQTSGSTSASFREFNPLFMRDGWYLQTTGLIASNNTYANDAVATYQHGDLGISLGQYHYKSDGYRDNNDTEQNIYDILAQYNFSAKTSIQVEYKHADEDSGDLRLIRSFGHKFRNNVDSDLWRLGLRHQFSPGSDMISNVTYKENRNRTQVVPFIDSKLDDDGFSAETQHVYSLASVRLISGFSHYHADQNCQDAAFFPVCLSTNPQLENNTGYLYSHWNLAKAFTVTAGLSADFLHDPSASVNQVNPKFGLTWQPYSGTTLRAAAF
ncbi:tetratricopeptide repeat protein [Methylocucumis oryzae]|uniref:FecR protein domain-containing protein n=1 Tax=Methylocucumis oryzae TaxID=1632867 RepID=A0A0F3IQH5_9GAMM|nr:tetratricopeptide repeat protein [Methylocucumis oryzae]KJV07834.1 hypothetical protein VZ94_01880 [Methylocucumis oryzae]